MNYMICLSVFSQELSSKVFSFTENRFAYSHLLNIVFLQVYFYIVFLPFKSETHTNDATVLYLFSQHTF